MDIEYAVTHNGQWGVQIGGIFGRGLNHNLRLSLCVPVISPAAYRPLSVNPIYGEVRRVRFLRVRISLLCESAASFRTTRAPLSGITVLPRAPWRKNHGFLNRLNAPYGPNPVWFTDRRDLNDGYPLPAYQNDPSWQVGMREDLPVRKPGGSGTAAGLTDWHRHRLPGSCIRSTPIIPVTAALYGLTADIDLPFRLKTHRASFRPCLYVAAHWPGV